MRKFTTLFLLSLFLCVLPGTVFADAKSDYEFQLSQYRRSYSEFTQLKRDYLLNPTLDNQQKSIITAKQVLLSRDLSKAAYARYMIDLINVNKTNYVPLQPIINRLLMAVDIFTASANLSQSITTPSDLKKFSDSYLINTISPDRSFYYGQVAVKLSQLVRFQLEAQNILDTIYPKLPDPQPIQLKARLDEFPVLAEDINQRIAAIVKMIIPEPEVEKSPVAPEQYFTLIIEKLTDIRSRQSALVDQLVDIDINYAQL